MASRLVEEYISRLLTSPLTALNKVDLFFGFKLDSSLLAQLQHRFGGRVITE